jgi:hypothetical protein
MFGSTVPCHTAAATDAKARLTAARIRKALFRVEFLCDQVKTRLGTTEHENDVEVLLANALRTVHHSRAHGVQDTDARAVFHVLPCEGGRFLALIDVEMNLKLFHKPRPYEDTRPEEHLHAHNVGQEHPVVRWGQHVTAFLIVRAVIVRKVMKARECLVGDEGRHQCQSIKKVPWESRN